MFDIEKSVLLVIDVQGQLAELMFEKDQFIHSLVRMIKAADILQIPILWTEQAPQKIGPTIPLIAHALPGHHPIEKTSFSCCINPAFMKNLSRINRQQILITGIETHVCVYQTVSDLIERKFQVQVVQDAVSSRTLENKEIGLERIRARGGELTSSETVICELLRTADHPKFKKILSLIK